MIIIRKTKYFYQNVPVYTYCKKSDLTYINVAHCIKYHLNKNQKCTHQELIDRIIEKYLAKQEIQKLKKTILYLEKQPKVNMTNVARTLKINYQAIIKIKACGFNNVQALKILVFLSDKIDHQGNTSITKKQLEKIQDLLQNKEKAIRADLMCLICLINLGYEDYYDAFLTQRQRYLKKLIYNRTQNVFTKKELLKSIFEDLYQDLMIKQYQIITKCYSRNIAQIIQYYNLCLKGQLSKSLQPFLKEANQVYLYDHKNKDQIYLDTISTEQC